ncbi:MAG: hypothetical protein M3Y56_05900, partial [Armatimonadota bacterium]|nr:hypothetical protein [Armatimonadota bacterium]
MIQPGVVDHVRVVRTSITSPVDPATGHFSLPAVPQGPLTLEFLDPNQRPFGYAQVVVQPNMNNIVPPIQGPVINPPSDGVSLGPQDTSVPSVAASFSPV